MEVITVQNIMKEVEGFYWKMEAMLLLIVCGLEM